MSSQLIIKEVRKELKSIKYLAMLDIETTALLMHEGIIRSIGIVLVKYPMDDRPIEQQIVVETSISRTTNIDQWNPNTLDWACKTYSEEQLPFIVNDLAAPLMPDWWIDGLVEAHKTIKTTLKIDKEEILWVANHCEFDFGKLNLVLDANKFDRPWHYQRVKDLESLFFPFNIPAGEAGCAEVHRVASLIHGPTSHNAIDDCILQLKKLQCAVFGTGYTTKAIYNVDPLTGAYLGDAWKSAIQDAKDKAKH